MINIESIRKDFPILNQKINGMPLVYLDSAATTHKPKQVLESINRYYSLDNSNVHRGVHTLSQRSTVLYENARDRIQSFINAASSDEIIFTTGTTAAVNLVAQSYGHSNISAGDEIIISEMEHHSNIVPWQILCGQVGAKLRVIPISDAGEIDIDAFKRLLCKKTKLVSLTHASNVLGTINPVKEVIDIAHENLVPVMIDGAQFVAHSPLDVQALDCDFYAFSGHKLYAPTGIGVLYGKRHWLASMSPCYGGGGMISRVTFSQTDFADVPTKFEAGTPNIAGAIALAAAVDYVESIGLGSIQQAESELYQYAKSALEKIEDLTLLASPSEATGVISFVMNGVHAHDIGTILDGSGVAVRAGHHCCMPLMKRLGVPATVRLSLGVYNRHQDIDALVSGIEHVKKVFK